MYEKLKTGIEILAGLTVVGLLINTYKKMFRSRTQDPLKLLKF